MRNRSLFVLALLAACVGPDDVDDANDRDDDGYIAFQAGGDDCDDGDAAVHPGADEVCANDTDDDCDGYIDDNGVGGGTFYPDDDLDGFGEASLAVEACTAPEGTVTVAGDCDDAVSTVNPDATEIWYDGIDGNCDGADDDDQDGDTFLSAAENDEGDDCDDTDPAVHPGATDTCGNHVDDDCDGEHDGCDWSGGGDPEWARVTVGAAVTPRLTAGDCDNDDHAELAIWLPDAAQIHLFWGTGWVDDDLTLVDAMLVLTMPTPEAGYGHVASLEQDFTGDGGADLVVGSWRPTTAGTVLMFDQLTQFLPDFTTSAADRTWTGPADGSMAQRGFGSTLVAMGQVPGTSFGSVGIPYDRSAGVDRCILLHDAPTSGIADAVADLVLDDCSGLVPGPLHVSGDTVALARVDLAHHSINSDSQVDLSVPDQPEMVLWNGSVAADVLRVAGDVDGDGTSEVAAIETNSANPAVRMPFGPIDSSTVPDAFRLEADPLVIEDFLDLHAVDVNGDDLLDVVVLMDLEFTGDPGATAVGVLFSPLPFMARNDVDRTTFDAVIDLPTGERATSIVPADIDGDGYTDLALPGTGQVRVLYGQGR